MSQGRRTLQFDTLDQVMPDVERLLEGHSTVGTWSLAQICRHLATVLRRVVDLPASTPQDPSQWVARSRKAGPGIGHAPRGSARAAGGPARRGPRRSRGGGRPAAAIAHYRASNGPVIPHRIFGPLTKAEWDRLQCIHLAHHLSFAVPAVTPDA